MDTMQSADSMQALFPCNYTGYDTNKGQVLASVYYDYILSSFTNYMISLWAPNVLILNLHACACAFIELCLRLHVTHNLITPNCQLLRLLHVYMYLLYSMLRFHVHS